MMISIRGLVDIHHPHGIGCVFQRCDVLGHLERLPAVIRIKAHLAILHPQECLRRCFAEAPKPNVIVILADDQGAIDLGAYGAKDLHTPNLDALAKRGVRFMQFYSAAPVCSPSRAGLLTGRWPVRAGVPSNGASQAGGTGALPPEEITMAEMFREAGYATAHIGKWHLGYTPETIPKAQGFDHSFGHMGDRLVLAGHQVRSTVGRTWRTLQAGGQGV